MNKNGIFAQSFEAFMSILMMPTVIFTIVSVVLLLTTVLVKSNHIKKTSSSQKEHDTRVYAMFEQINITFGFVIVTAILSTIAQIIVNSQL